MNRHESIEILGVKKSTQSGEVVEVPPSEIKNKTVYPSIKLDVTYTSDYKTVCVGTVCNFERFNDIYNALKTITTAFNIPSEVLQKPRKIFTAEVVRFEDDKNDEREAKFQAKNKCNTKIKAYYVSLLDNYSKVIERIINNQVTISRDILHLTMKTKEEVIEAQNSYEAQQKAEHDKLSNLLDNASLSQDIESDVNEESCDCCGSAESDRFDCEITD